MQAPSGFGIGTSGQSERPVSAGFGGPAGDGFFAWGDFDPPGAAKWRRLTSERGTPWL